MQPQPQQQTLYVTQGHLFSISAAGITTDKGTCGCALVALPTPTSPKYSLVCYSKRRETLAVTRLQNPSSGANPLSLFRVEFSGYVSFTDEVGDHWSLLLAKPDGLVELLAHLTLAFYMLGGERQRSAPVVTDFSPASADVGLGVHHEARVRYTAYVVRRNHSNRNAEDLSEVTSDRSSASPLAQLGPVRESNMNEQQQPLYAFQPVPSSVMINEGHRGFEGCLAGMREGTYRGIVLPTAQPYTRAEDVGRDGMQDFSPVVYVVRLDRMVELAAPPQRNSEVPTVFADGAYGNGNISNRTTPSLQNDARALAVTNAVSGVASHLTSTALVAAPTQPSYPSPSMPAVTIDGDGIPTEHMAMVQRIGAGIHTATTAARDIRDATAAVASDWERATQTAARPSVLTHAILLDQLRQLVMQHEQSRAALEHRDELMRTLDSRNRDLQRQADCAALTAQKLMDASKAAANAGADARLERSRTLVKLQGEIAATTRERDDAQRHLTTVKRLHAAAEEELQKVRSRADIHRVQATGALEQMDAAQNTLSEARARRRGLEARAASLADAVRSAHAQARVKVAEVESARAAADRARQHHLQLMEDERNSRAADAQQLRTEIVAELANKEKTARAERARAAEESFRRGLDEGKAAGYRDAAADVAAQQRELQLAMQRSQSAVESAKEELRAGIAGSMGARRRLQTAVKECQNALTEAIRDRTKLQFRRDRLSKEVATAKEVILGRLRGVARYLTQPATPAQLLSILTVLRHHGVDLGESYAESNSSCTSGTKEAKSTRGSTSAMMNAAAGAGVDIDIAFNRMNRESARRMAIERRVGWMSAEALRVAEKGMQFYYSEWFQPLTRAHADCKAAVKALWVAERGAAHYTLCEEEQCRRYAITQESDAFFAALNYARDRQRQARAALRQQAEEGLASLYMAFTDGLARLRSLYEEQMRARQALATAESMARQELAAQAARAFREMPALFADAILSDRLTSQRYVAEEEEAGRAALLADEVSTFTVLRFNEEIAREEARVAAAWNRQASNLRSAESDARAQLKAEEVALREAAEQRLLQGIASVLQRSQAARQAIMDVEIAESDARAEIGKAEMGELTSLVDALAAAILAAEERQMAVEREKAAADTAAAAAAAMAAATQVRQKSSSPAPSEPSAAVPPADAEGLPTLPTQQEEQLKSTQSGAATAATPAAQPKSAIAAAATSVGWDGPPEVPPPTPPDTPESQEEIETESGAPSPFAVAWAQSDRRTTPVPDRVPHPGAADSPRLPPAVDTTDRKAAAPLAKRRELFASSSDDD